MYAHDSICIVICATVPAPLSLRSSLKEHVFELGDRASVLDSLDDGSAVIPHVAEAEGARLTYEVIFRYQRGSGVECGWHISSSLRILVYKYKPKISSDSHIVRLPPPLGTCTNC